MQANFRKKIDFSELPNDWRVARVAVDWNGGPLVLIEEGKPPRPPREAGIDSIVAWRNTPPKARHLIFEDGPFRRAVTFEGSTTLTAFHVQPFEGGWLLGETRGGTGVYDEKGKLQRVLDLGDASNDIQTTPTGHIWVSYFDEGVFGSGIGQHGLVCFDREGKPLFKYSEFAEKNNLPFVDDCYALNVVDEDEVWLSYYTDFPLVLIKNFRLQRVWKDFGCMARGFALWRDYVLFQKCYTRPSQLLRRGLSDSPQAEPIEAIDEDGTLIGGDFVTAGRGAHFYLQGEAALYELTI